MSSPTENRRSSDTTPEMGKSEETYDPQSLKTVPRSQSPTSDGDQRNLQELKNDLALIFFPQARANEGPSSSHHPIEYNVHLRLKQTLSYIISTYTTELRSTQVARQMVIKAEPISCIPSGQEENWKRKRVTTTPVGEIVVESFVLPKYLGLDFLDLENLLPMDEELYASIVHRTRKYSFAQRLRGWKIERRQRSTLMCDMYYRHQESSMFFRSNAEVVNFILYEAKPQDKRTTKRKTQRIADSAETSEQGRRKRLKTPTTWKGRREATADHCESCHGGDEYSIESVVQAAVALLQLSLYEEIHTGPSAPPTSVSHEPEREWKASLIPLDAHANNPDVSHPVDAEPNPSPDQQEDQPENVDVNPPVESTEPNPKALVDGLNASDQAEPNGGDEEGVRKVEANDTTTVDEDENLFEGLEPLDGKKIYLRKEPEIPDLNYPVDSTEPNPRAPVDGLNASDQAETNGGDQEGFKEAEANDPTTVDEDENLFEELGPLDGRIFYLPEL